MESSIFVTGGTGFVGSYLLRYLVAKGYRDITALKRRNSSMALVEEVQDKINWVEGDILDVPFLEEVMADKKQVYHCAAMVSFDPADKEQLLQINVEGTANIVNIALYHSIKKLVHISSVAAIGKEKDDKRISEETKWKGQEGISNYAKSKYEAEMEVWRGIAEGLNAAILNPSLILGSGFWNRGTGAIFSLYGNGFPFYSEGVGGVVDVRDVAKFAIQLMESNIQEERFIISAKNIGYKTLFDQIATLAGKKSASIKMNPLMGKLGWRVEKIRSFLTGKKPTITKESIRSAAAKAYYTNQKSIDSLGCSYTPIEETIAATVQQYLKSKGQPVALPLN